MPMQRIKDEVFRVTFEWQSFMEKVHEDMIRYTERDKDYDFAKRADAFIEYMQQPKRKLNKNIYRHSPIETLYLKILKYECFGQIGDNNFANHLDCINDYFVPQELVQEMRLLCKNYIAVDDIEEYIKDNAAKIEKYVYINKEPHKENRRRIRNSTDKVLDVLKFCTNVWIDKDNTIELKEIWIISCLQAILIDSPNEIFNYPLYGEQKHRKSKQRVQAVLKSNERAYGALQLYWNRKVGDRWYANVGKLELRKKLREIENTCDATLWRILSCSDIYDMRGTHEHYFSKASGLLLEMSTL
jgi:hypothetical protein